MDKKSLILGLFIGMLIGVPVAWAAGQITWVDGSGEVFGTISNPIFIESI